MSTFTRLDSKNTGIACSHEVVKTASGRTRFVEVSDTYMMDQKVKTARIMSKLDKIARENEAEEHKYGWCPECFMNIPMSGICTCGYNATKRR